MRPLIVSIWLLTSLVPLLGSLFFDWDILVVFCLFWIEHIFVWWFLNLFLLSATGVKSFRKLPVSIGLPGLIVGLIFTNIIFLTFSLFAAIMVGSILDLHGADMLLTSKDGNLIERIITVYSSNLTNIKGMWLGVTVVVIQEFILLFQRLVPVVKKNSSIKVSPVKHFVQPIFGMHAIIVFGGILTMVFGSSIGLIFMIVIIKMSLEYKDMKKKSLGIEFNQKASE